jgi:hypothetical protein
MCTVKAGKLIDDKSGVVLCSGVVKPQDRVMEW